jgi:alkylation response protein AidB-like acyl-CoA dehydrogenase
MLDPDFSERLGAIVRDPIQAIARTCMNMAIELEGRERLAHEAREQAVTPEEIIGAAVLEAELRGGRTALELVADAIQKGMATLV